MSKDDECENDVAEEIAEALKSGKPITRSIQFKSKTSTMPQRSFCFFPFHDLGNLAEYAFVIAADDISNVRLETKVSIHPVLGRKTVIWIDFDVS